MRVGHRPFWARILASGLCVLVLAASLFAQSVGTVMGAVTDPTGAVIPGASVTLTAAISGYRQNVQTDAEGQYRFVHVPFSPFTLHVEAPGFDHFDATGELRTNVPLVMNAQLTLAAAKQEVTVVEQGPLLETTSASTHHDIDYKQLQKLGLAQAGRGLEALVQTVPGVVQDDNGRMHPRGSESQVQYVVDGVPITDNLAATFGTALDARNLRSAEILTGNVPAEYGGKLATVINVNTKSGLEMPWNGSLSFGGGSFNQLESGAEFGGHTRKFGVFVSSAASHSERYLDPPEIQNFRNEGGNARLFAKFDWIPTDKDTLRLSLTTNGSNFQVPNTAEQQAAGQRQGQELRDDAQSLAWTHLFDPRTVSDVVAYRRSSTAHLLDPEQTGFPFFAEQHRRQRTEGLRASISRQQGGHSLKFGVQVTRLPLSEFFTVAATDPAILADPANPLSAFPITSPFVFNQKKTGREVALFVQDRFTIAGRLTIDAGLRYDNYRIVAEKDFVSPRVGLAYYIKRTGTVFRGSYNRLFQTPSVENLLLSSSAEGVVFSPLGSTAGVRVVPPEEQNFYEFGVQQQLGKYVRLDVAHYVKNIRNYADKDQFLNTGIIFPIAIARGDVRGTEARLDLALVRGWTAFLSYANSKAIATTPLVGGLFLGEEAAALLIPGVQFNADHDQRNSGQFGVTYSHRSGAWASLSGRHDSGVPSEFDPADLAGLDPRIVEQLDTVRFRIKPRTTLDLAAGIDLLRDSSWPISLQLDVQNLLDRFYLFNFESVFSGTHIGRPREISARIVFHWKAKSVQSP
ncbi:MAG TPA: TonB-dependent receptor [Terriglobales bacterium]|nr:TonB-dependent receptor [Terriglobales bacterium]